MNFTEHTKMTSVDKAFLGGLRNKTERTVWKKALLEAQEAFLNHRKNRLTVKEDTQ